MRELHLAVRIDDDDAALSLLRQLVEVSMMGEEPGSDFVYRAWVSEPRSDRFIPNGSQQNRDA